MTKAKISDILKFTGKFFTKPRTTGSIIPSSNFLGRRMARSAAIKPGMAVVELGPGTGPITANLLATGMDPELLYCIEFDTKLCEILRRRFPGVHVINDSAERTSAIMGGEKPGVCAVVSSLPLVSLPRPLCEAIMRESESVLETGGRFVQFTYNLKRKPDEAFSFDRMRYLGHSTVMANIPPARVDVFEKF